jgi:hypothetical protein
MRFLIVFLPPADFIVPILALSKSNRWGLRFARLRYAKMLAPKKGLRKASGFGEKLSPAANKPSF